MTVHSFDHCPVPAVSTTARLGNHKRLAKRVVHSPAGIAAAFTLALSGLLAAPAAAQPEAFSYQANRAPAIGTVTHFTKSNRDGSEAWHIAAFVTSPTRIEVVKWVEGATDFVEVHADFDLATAAPVVMRQWNTTRDGREPRLWAVLDSQRQVLDLTLANGQNMAVPFGAAPLHVWGFDLMGLAFMLPHLADPTSAFSVTFLDPNRPGSGGMPVMVDRATLTPDGDEQVGEVPCRRYRLAGPVFGDASGTVWVAKADGHLVKAEHAIRTSTDWTDFRLERTRSEPMDGIAWERFKLGLAAAIQNAGGAPRGPSAAAAMKAAYDSAGLAAALAAGEAARTAARDALTKAWASDLNTFGYTLLGFEKTADAVAVFTQATKESPTDANAWDSLGEALVAAGKLPEAATAYRRALELDPSNDRARGEVARLGGGQ